MLQLGMKSDLGQARIANEDSCLARVLASQGEKLALLAVADGIGGHRAGEVASRTAINCLESAVITALEKGEALLLSLERAVRSANQTVFELATLQEQFSGMGTTLTTAVLSSQRLFAAHVGDSRLYLYRAGTCSQLSIDHNLVSELVKNGEISADEAKSHPQRNVLTRAVGIGAKVEIDLITQSLLPGDVVLLASDGLFTLLDNQAIARHLTTEQDLQKVAENLVAAANELGGHDNISVVLAKWGWDG